MNPGYPALVESRAVVLRLDNVDTDVITPIARVLEGPAAVVRWGFEPLRFDEDGRPRADDPFGDPRRIDAQVLVVGRNFGCGSSRETAAAAVRGMGFRVVIAPSYGDIFYSNCLKNGVLAIRLSETIVEALMDLGDALATFAIDLPSQRLRCADLDTGFEIGALQKHLLLSGLDEIGLMQSRASERTLYDQRDHQLRPWVRTRPRND